MFELGRRPRHRPDLPPEEACYTPVGLALLLAQVPDRPCGLAVASLDGALHLAITSTWNGARCPIELLLAERCCAAHRQRTFAPEVVRKDGFEELVLLGLGGVPNRRTGGFWFPHS